jgi:hypothetical protein
MGIKNVADLVPLNPSYPDALNPVRRDYIVVPFQVQRTNTTAVKVAVLPADATILGIRYYVQTPTSGGGTTAATVTLTGQGVGPGGATFAFGSQSVFAAGTGLMNATVNTVTGIFNLERPPATQTSGDIIVYATYAETGGTSTAGGPFYFIIEYVR